MGFRACTCNPMVCAVLSSNAPLKSHRHHHCFSTPHWWAYEYRLHGTCNPFVVFALAFSLQTMKEARLMSNEALRGKLRKRLGVVCYCSALNVFHLSECHLSLSLSSFKLNEFMANSSSVLTSTINIWLLQSRAQKIFANSCHDEFL